MTEKRLDVNSIDDLFIRNEIIRLYEENEQLKSEFKDTGRRLNKVMRLLVSKEYAQMFIELQDVLYELSEKELIE